MVIGGEANLEEYYDLKVSVWPFCRLLMLFLRVSATKTAK